MDARHDANQSARRSIRLRGFDYAQQGAYFVTICTHHRACLFGEVVDDEMRLNANGRLVNETWMGMPRHYPHVELDTVIVMPNHVHGILVLVGSGLQPAPPRCSPYRRSSGDSKPSRHAESTGHGPLRGSRCGNATSTTISSAMRSASTESANTSWTTRFGGRKIRKTRPVGLMGAGGFETRPYICLPGTRRGGPGLLAGSTVGIGRWWAAGETGGDGLRLGLFWWCGHGRV